MCPAHYRFFYDDALYIIDIIYLSIYLSIYIRCECDAGLEEVISKLLERLVASQLTAYLSDNKLLPDHQSAYRAFCSTETVIARVFSDILTAIDSGDIAALCLLDLSAAFDTVDHSILLRRLQRSYGL